LNVVYNVQYNATVLEELSIGNWNLEYPFRAVPILEAAREQYVALTMSEEQDALTRSRKRKDLPTSSPPSSNTSDDDDEEQQVEQRGLDWRMDPEESHSDWTIEVTVNSKLHSTYHVHKCMLSVGSGYFSRLFGTSKSFSETQNNKSSIDVHELAAKAFPVMLDFLYFLWGDGESPIIDNNCTALYYLGAYFEIRRLRKEARRYRKYSMRSCWPKPFSLYYEHAKIFHDESTRKSVMKGFLKYAYHLESSDKLFRVTDSQFWLDVLNENGGKANQGLSIGISNYCRCQKDSLTFEVFSQLTDASLLPEISSGWETVSNLMQIEKALGHSGATTSMGEDEQLSSLQERCIEALVSNWERFQHDDWKNALLGIGVNVYTSIMAKLLDKTLGPARQLDLLKERLPKAVVVSGAGVDLSFLNGVYSRQESLSMGAPRFTRTLEQGGGLPVCYDIFMTYGDIWLISSLVNDDPDDDEPIEYYTCEYPSKAPILPPTSGWTPVIAEAHPMLSLTLKY